MAGYLIGAWYAASGGEFTRILIKTMQYQYGFDENIARIYLELYSKVANSDKMKNKSNSGIVCEFNRIIASLCLNYDGTAQRWKITVGNYKPVDAYKMLIEEYGFSEADAIDFAIAINVQHGTSCEQVEKAFGFSRKNGSSFIGEDPPTIEDFERRSSAAGASVMKDFTHEAIQYVEFNDGLDAVDCADGSTDRMISYSGDITSRRYDESDFLTDIDANNIQKRFEESDDNFLKTQHDYNNGVRNGQINPKEEFIENNGGIDQIRKNIEYDITSMSGAYIDGGSKGIIADYLGILILGDDGVAQSRIDEYEEDIDAFTNFLKN